MSSQAGQNVIAAIKADNAETRAENKARFAEVNARLREMKAENDARFREMKAENDARFREVMAEIRVVNGRIDMLRQVMWRVVWPLVVLVFSIVMGVFYRFLFDV